MGIYSRIDLDIDLEDTTKENRELLFNELENNEELGGTITHKQDLHISYFMDSQRIQNLYYKLGILKDIFKKYSFVSEAIGLILQEMEGFSYTRDEE